MVSRLWYYAFSFLKNANLDTCENFELIFVSLPEERFNEEILH